MNRRNLSPPGVRWEDVTVSYGERSVVDHFSLAVEPGTWTAVIGPNGAGKTTLLRTLAGTVRHQGRIVIGGDDASTLAGRERARRMAVVPQHPTVPPGMRVFDYVLLGRSPHQGLRYAASDHDRQRSASVIERLHLAPFIDRAVDSLSGGERQRAVIARALAQDARILALDEPTSFLDLGHQVEVLELLSELREEQPLTVVSTLHDLSVAGQFSDLIAVVDGGRLVAHGTPTQVLVPEVIAQHWNVDARTEAHADGSVTVAIHRRPRRQQGSQPS